MRCPRVEVSRVGVSPSHLCHDLAVLRHVDLHGHTIRGALQNGDWGGTLCARRHPWVLAPILRHDSTQGRWGWGLHVPVVGYCMHPSWWDPLGAAGEGDSTPSVSRDPSGQGYPKCCPRDPPGNLGPVHGALV